MLQGEMLCQECWAVRMVVAASRVVAVSRLGPGGSTVWHKQERDRDGMQSMSGSQTLQQAAQAAASTWGPLMPSPQLFVLLQPLASALTGAGARVRTCTRHPHLEAPEEPAAPPQPYPFLA